MKQFRATIISVNFCTSFGLLGELRCLMALIWSGFTSIPQFIIMYLRNFRTPTPKAHLLALRRNLYCLSIKRLLQILYTPLVILTLNYHVIYIHFHCTPNLISEHPHRHPLISGPCIFKSEGHHRVVIIAL